MNERNRDHDRDGRRDANSNRRGEDRGRGGSNHRSSAGSAGHKNGSSRREGERPRRDGESRGSDRGYDRKPRGEGSRPFSERPRRDGERRYEDRPRRDGERREWGDRPRRDGDARPSGDRQQGNGGRRDDRGYGRPRRDGDRPHRSDDARRDDRRFDRKPRGENDRGYDRNASRGGKQRGGGRGFDSAPRRDGDRHFDDRPRRDGEQGYDRKPRRDGERRDGHDRPRRDGDRRFDDRPRRDEGDRGKPSFGRGGTRGGGRSDRGGAQREFTEAERLQHELRPVRAEHDDPAIPEEITEKDLHPGARNELKTLQPETAERVARHLAMVASLITDDPELAHQHAISASRRAGRIPVARETLAITAFHIGDYALALRELRTYRRLTGSQGHLALMVECERALGRPERGIETGLAAEMGKLNTEQRVQLAIAMSGARLDLGQAQQALFELEIPELNPNKAFDWSPELFAAYATVLEDLGRDAESRQWHERAIEAEAAINELLGSQDQLEVLEIVEMRVNDDRYAEAEPDDAVGAEAERGDAESDEGDR